MRKVSFLFSMSMLFCLPIFSQFVIGSSAIFHMKSGSTVYINGLTLQPTSNITLTNNNFGKSLYPNDGYYNGNIDDFRIYDYFLSIINKY